MGGQLRTPKLSLADAGGGPPLVTLSLIVRFFLYCGFPKWNGFQCVVFSVVFINSLLQEACQVGCGSPKVYPGGHLAEEVQKYIWTLTSGYLKLKSVIRGHCNCRFEEICGTLLVNWRYVFVPLEAGVTEVFVFTWRITGITKTQNY